MPPVETITIAMKLEDAGGDAIFLQKRHTRHHHPVLPDHAALVNMPGGSFRSSEPLKAEAASCRLSVTSPQFSPACERIGDRLWFSKRSDLRLGHLRCHDDSTRTLPVGQPLPVPLAWLLQR